MAYQVLARKWRPRNFQELVGQEHVLRPLVNALDSQRLHHAYLFTGTRGVGKTTIARIIAKCLNCMKGVTSQPCGTCTSCEEIDQGRFIDLIEVDAASRTKVEDTRELLDNVQYAPTRGRYKVYLIDEVHMLSGHSFNALLKTLEEPPEHVKFLLATTDPKRLPITVLSRCLQFHLKNLSPELIEQHLQFVLKQEHIPYEIPALSALSHAASGSVRDALSLLDQAIAYGAGNVQTADVVSMLGTVEQHLIQQLLSALAIQDISAVIHSCREMASQAIDFSQVLEALLSLLHRIAVMQALPERAIETDALETLAKQISPEDVQLWYQIGLIGRRDLPLAPSPLSGFEMILLRMLVFQPGMPSPAAAKDAAATSPRGRGERHPLTSELSPPLQNLSQKALSREGVDSRLVRVGGISSIETWPALLPQLKLTGLSHTLATHCSQISFEQDHLRLTLSSNHAPLLNSKTTERIEQALTQHFQRPIKLNIELNTEAPIDTPAALAKQQLAEQQKNALNTLQNDTNLQVLLKTFDATIQPETIKTK
jgi:DNA polymerase-3 subunit gamma/tau